MHPTERATRRPLTEDELLPLVTAAIAGDREAWGLVWNEMEPLVWRITGRARVTGPLVASPEDRDEVVLLVMLRFQADEHRRLRMLEERLLRKDGSFRGWLSVLVRNTAISYVRTHPRQIGTRKAPRWAVHEELSPSMVDDGDGALDVIAAKQLADFIVSTVDEIQYQAISLWSLNVPDEEIAAELKLPDAEAARRVIRAGQKRLRDRRARLQEFIFGRE